MDLGKPNIIILFFLQGLSCLKNLQHLSLAHNHLARVNEIENCMLLQMLNLQANNLQEVGCYQLYRYDKQFVFYMVLLS